MKNFIKFLVLFSFISVLYTSCQKDNFIESEFITTQIEQVKVLDNIETVTNPISIEEYTLNSIDIDDENINKQLLETADMNKQPLICPGFEVNSELEGLEDFEDYIVAWFYDENNNLNEILINEEMALSTSHPVFVIENSEEASFNIKSFNTDQSTNINLKSATPDGNIKMNEFMINERYEGSGRSEFCITAALITESGDAKYILDGDSKRYIKFYFYNFY